jgi:hypothetical protein
MARVREGRYRKYVQRAVALADEGGYSPTAAELDDSARRLMLADLAGMRLKAMCALRRTEASSPGKSGVPNAGDKRDRVASGGTNLRSRRRTSSSPSSYEGNREDAA